LLAATVVSDGGGFALADVDVAVTCTADDARDAGDDAPATPHDPETMSLTDGGGG
jgi:hypothetical protein